MRIKASCSPQHANGAEDKVHDTMPGKHIPQRTCVGCHEVHGKRQLIRVIRTPDGRVQIDPSGKRNGRGAYLHQRRSCWDKALKGALSRALRIERIADEDRAALQAYMLTCPDDVDEVVA
jgi:predicted RNA-binding protein YlxR (DUF448 family)